MILQKILIQDGGEERAKMFDVNFEDRFIRHVVNHSGSETLHADSHRGEMLGDWRDSNFISSF